MPHTVQVANADPLPMAGSSSVVGPSSAAPQAGVIQLRRLVDTPGPYDYYLYMPRSAVGPSRLFVTVHGISRNALEHIKAFAAFAERYGVVAIAPSFPADRFPDYQRLGRLGRGEQAALALQKIAAEVAGLVPVDSTRLYLFGYSGGGQFVHRFVMAHPDRVARYAVAAAGWYTFPDLERRYPLGIKRVHEQGDLRFIPEDFLRVPGMVVVGEHDTSRHGNIRVSATVTAQQGETRLERGRNWVAAMQCAATAYGYATRYEFKLLADSRHLFNQCMQRGAMGDAVFEFLFGAG